MKLSISKCVLSILLSVLSLNVYAEWQCYVSDVGGHFWKSAGSTPERAIAVATSFCSAYSPNGDTCKMSKCIEK